MPINDEEWKQIEGIWSEIKRQKPIYKHDPNVVIDIYKNRRGELNSVKVFRYFDYGTLRCEDLFITDSSYKSVMEIGQLKYEETAYDFLDLKTRGVFKC